ncbi:hypothetical protein ACIGN6_25360 [Streptomyces sp. NPDC053792]|uniref:hypothetical protein n=1 Tax=unclassified Streptomyces TaxID=2593676 RepID=UPI003430B91F
MRDERRDTEFGELLRVALSGERAAAGERAGHEGEAAALAAFRAARDAGLHASPPTRDLDDWTPVTERRRPRRPLKTLVAALVASATLGGVAVATGELPEHFLGTPTPSPELRPTRSATDPAPSPAHSGLVAGTTSAATRTATPGTTAPQRPEKDPVELPGKSREALCHAFEKDEGRGKASTSAAWQRLVTAAGGEEFVPGYCGYDPRAARTSSAEPRPNGNNGGWGDFSDSPGRGAERSRADRP